MRTSEEKKKTDLTDASSLENIDALVTTLPNEENRIKHEQVKQNFLARMNAFCLDDISMWMLLYWIIYMPDDEYNTFMDFVCAGYSILTEGQIRAMETYRREEIKDKELDGTMDSSVLSFMYIFYKV